MKSTNPTDSTPASSTVLNLTGAQELLNAGKALGAAIQPGNGLQPYAIVPPGHTLSPIPREPLPALPDHIRQKVKLEEMESFVAYVNAFKTHTTRIFARRPNLAEVKPGSSGGASFTALLDYHEGGRDPLAKRAAHVAVFPVPLSLEFSTWLGLDGKPLAQMDFVQFIEANCADVVTPDSATLMEMALNFEAKTSVNFQSKVNRVTGGRELVFQEAVEAGAPSVGSMKVPEWMTLRLAVFEGGKSYELKARLEYRPNSGRLAITYHLQRPHDVVRAAIKDMREEIAAATELEILTGAADPV